MDEGTTVGLAMVLAYEQALEQYNTRGPRKRAGQ